MIKYGTKEIEKESNRNEICKSYGMVDFSLVLLKSDCSFHNFTHGVIRLFWQVL